MSMSNDRMGHSHIGPSRSRPGSRHLVILMLYREDKVRAKDFSWLHHHDLPRGELCYTYFQAKRQTFSALCAHLHLQKVERARGRGTEPVVTPSGIRYSTLKMSDIHLLGISRSHPSHKLRELRQSKSTSVRLGMMQVPSCGYTGLREPTAKVRYGMNIKLPCTTPAADDEQTKSL